MSRRPESPAGTPPVPAVPADTTPLHTLHVVSGKGGTGKTTIAGAIACALATAGRRVLVCEVEGRQGLADLFDTEPLRGDTERRLCRTPAGGEVFGLSVDAEDALLEYLDTFYHLGLAGRALDRFGVVDFATSIAPGLRDVLLTGKVYEAVRRGPTKRPHAYDAVVLDAPPTGRIAQFLNVHDAVAGLAKVGPIRSQADSIMAMLRSARTAVHLVTLLEDMPVTETEEAIAALRPTQIEVTSVIANLVAQSPLDLATLERAAAGRLPLAVPGLGLEEREVLAAEFAVEAARTLAQLERRERIRTWGLPVVEIAFDAAGVDSGAPFAIAGSLAAQLTLETAR